MARKTAARGRRSEPEVAEIPRSLDGGGRLASAGQGAATARRVARWTAARSGGDGWVARATQRGEKAVDGRGGRHDRAHHHASCAPGAARDVHVEGAAQEGGRGPRETAYDGKGDHLPDRWRPQPKAASTTDFVA